MSKSFRKPYDTHGNKSKKDKPIMHRKARAMVRTKLSSIDNFEDFDEVILPRKNKEVVDINSFNQDGKQIYWPEDPKLTRK